MAKKKLSLSDEIVRKSNAAARCRWEVKSVLEPRIVALLASKIKPTDNDFQVYNITITELIGKNASGQLYKELEHAVDKLMSRIITIYDDNGWTKYHLFYRCRYHKNEGLLEIGIDPELKPHYLQLKNHFIQYNLSEFMQLPSIYSQRMYEYLKSWSNNKDCISELNYLHEMLNTPPSFRKNFKDFRRYVLDKAHKDIHAKTSFTYRWEAIKEGRAVTKIRFIFSKDVLTTNEQKEIDVKNRYRKLENEIFLTQMKCKSVNGEDCKGGKNKKAVCEFCIKLRTSNKK